MPSVKRPTPSNSHTQSVIVKKANYTLEKAEKWCKDHNFYIDGLDITGNTYRFRQYNPSNKFNYRSKIATAGITLIIAFLK